jgi:Zn-dependent membrane protease YugP
LLGVSIANDELNRAGVETHAVGGAIEHGLRIVSMSFRARFALFWHHVQKVDACCFEVGHVLQHADHFFHMAFAGIGNQQVPEHD